MSFHPPIKITSLPSDVLYDILSYTPHLHSLSSILLSHSTFYTTFRDRRSLIIKSIFRNQIFHISYGLEDRGKVGSIYLKKTKAYVDNLSPNHQPDTALLYEAVWPYFEKRLPLTVSVEFGRLHTVAYEQAGQTKEAIDLAELIWDKISQRIGNLTPRDQDHAGTLCQLYYNHGRNSDAFVLQEEVLSRMPIKSAEFKKWAIQISNSYWRDKRYEDAASFQRRMWHMHMGEEDSLINSGLEWARHLVLSYSRRGLKDTAVEVEMEVMNTLNPRTMECIAWSRHLIQTLKGLGRMEEALEVRLHIWRNYHLEMNGYYGWARQFSEDYRALDRENDAVAVEEVVWQEIKRRLLARPKDRALIYHARAAGHTLAKSYRQRGSTEMALVIESQIIV